MMEHYYKPIIMREHSVMSLTNQTMARRETDLSSVARATHL